MFIYSFRSFYFSICLVFVICINMGQQPCCAQSDGFWTDLELASACARLPLVIAQNRLERSSSPRKIQKLVALMVSAVRAANGIASIRNNNGTGHHFYNIAWTFADTAQVIVQTLEVLGFSTYSLEKKTQYDDAQDEEISGILSIFVERLHVYILPIIESGAAVYVAIGKKGTPEYNAYCMAAEAVGSIARLLADTLILKTSSLEFKIYLMVLCAHALMILYEFKEVFNHLSVRLSPIPRHGSTTPDSGLPPSPPAPPTPSVPSTVPTGSAPTQVPGTLPVLPAVSTPAPIISTSASPAIVGVPPPDSISGPVPGALPLPVPGPSTRSVPALPLVPVPQQESRARRLWQGVVNLAHRAKDLGVRAVYGVQTPNAQAGLRMAGGVALVSGHPVLAAASYALGSIPLPPPSLFPLETAPPPPPFPPGIVPSRLPPSTSNLPPTSVPVLQPPMPSLSTLPLPSEVSALTLVPPVPLPVPTPPVQIDQRNPMRLISGPSKQSSLSLSASPPQPPPPPVPTLVSSAETPVLPAPTLSTPLLTPSPSIPLIPVSLPTLPLSPPSTSPVSLPPPLLSGGSELVLVPPSVPLSPSPLPPSADSSVLTSPVIHVLPPPQSSIVPPPPTPLSTVPSPSGGSTLTLVPPPTALLPTTLATIPTVSAPSAIQPVSRDPAPLSVSLPVAHPPAERQPVSIPVFLPAAPPRSDHPPAPIPPPVVPPPVQIDQRALYNPMRWVSGAGRAIRWVWRRTLHQNTWGDNDWYR